MQATQVSRMWVALICMCVLTAKGIYLINEETLIALTFITFILLSYTAIGKFIGQELDDRSAQLIKEFDFSNRLCENALVMLLEYYTKRKQLFERLTNLVQTSTTEVTSALTSKQQQLLSVLVHEQVTKLKLIAQKEYLVFNELKNETSHAVVSGIVTPFKLKSTTATSRYLKTAVLTYNIEQLQKVSLTHAISNTRTTQIRILQQATCSTVEGALVPVLRTLL